MTAAEIVVAEFLRSRLLHRSDLLSVADVRCTCPRGGAGAEEFSGSTSLAIARAGVFVRHLGRATVVADANVVSVFRPGVGYRVSHPCEGGDDCTSIRPSDVVLREILRTVDPAAADRDQAAPAPDAGPWGPGAFLLQSLLVAALRSPWPDPLEIEEIGVELVAKLIGGTYAAAADAGRRRGPRTSSARNAHLELVQRAKVLLHERAPERLDLGAIARAAHASPWHLSRVFREQTGTTMTSYVAALRLRRGVREVIEGQRDLASAAVRAGFYDQSHFTNACRREFGVTPSGLTGLSRRELAQMSKRIQEPLGPAS